MLLIRVHVAMKKRLVIQVQHEHDVLLDNGKKCEDEQF